MVYLPCRLVRWRHDIPHISIQAFDHHQGFEGHCGGRGQLAHLLFDTITLGFIGSGTSESISSLFLATPSGFENQDMVVESKAGVDEVFRFSATTHGRAVMLIRHAFSY